MGLWAGGRRHRVWVRVWARPGRGSWFGLFLCNLCMLIRPHHAAQMKEPKDFGLSGMAMVRLSPASSELHRTRRRRVGFWLPGYRVM